MIEMGYDFNFLRNPQMRRGFEDIFGQIENKMADVWYVNTSTGKAGNNGKTEDTPFLTMEDAFDSVSTGDIIYLRGRLTEALTTPAAALDVTIIGVAPNHRAGGAEWKSDASDGDSPLTVITPGWKVVNIMFKGTTANPAITLEYDADSKWSNRFSAYNCEFQNGMGGIWDDGGTDGVKIIDCNFRNMTEESDDSYAIKGVSTAIALPLWWIIQGCTFIDNKNHILLDANSALVKDCVFTNKGHSITTVTKLDLSGSGGQGKNNIVTGCFFGGDYRTNNDEYVSGTDDQWVGNFVETVDGVEKDSGVWNLVPTT
jgi:hypothetical protein